MRWSDVRGRKAGVRKMVAVFSVPCVLFALSGCGTTKAKSEPADATLVQLTKSAMQAFEIGAYTRAARFYELALNRAWMIDDPQEAANNAFNLAACRILGGELDAADRALDSARGAYERIGRDTTPVTLLEAKLALAKGERERAEALIEQALAQARSDDDRLQAWILRTDAASDEVATDQAVKALASARRLFNDTSDPALKAGVARVSGRVALLQNDPAKAAAEFDLEAAFQQDAHRYAEMAQALDRAGGAYRQASKPADAAGRWYRAARSMAAQARYAEALVLVDKAMDAAVAGGSEAQKAEIRALFEQIRGEVGQGNAAP
jgi:tetratricopeptide (TPR) repeat protein